MTSIHIENDITFSRVYPDLDFDVFEKDKDIITNSTSNPIDTKLGIMSLQASDDPGYPGHSHSHSTGYDIDNVANNVGSGSTSDICDRDGSTSQQSGLTRPAPTFVSKCIICFENICEPVVSIQTTTSNSIEYEWDKKFLPANTDANNDSMNNLSMTGKQESIFHDFSKLFKISPTIYQDIDLNSLTNPLFCSSCCGKICESIRILREIEKLERNLSSLKKEIRGDLLHSYRCHPEGFQGDDSHCDEQGSEIHHSISQSKSKFNSKNKDQIRKAFAQCWTKSIISLRPSPAVQSATNRKRRRIVRAARVITNIKHKIEEKIEEEVKNNVESDAGSLYEPNVFDCLNSDVDIDDDIDVNLTEEDENENQNENKQSPPVDSGHYILLEGKRLRKKRKMKVDILDPDFDPDADAIVYSEDEAEDQNGNEPSEGVPRKLKKTLKRKLPLKRKRTRSPSGLGSSSSKSKSKPKAKLKRLASKRKGITGNSIGNPVLAFQCEFCKRYFNREDYKTEGGDYVITCDLPNCKTTRPFTSLAIFRKHHQLNCLSKPDYTCEHCNRRCFSSKTLKLHIISRHPVNKKGVLIPVRPTSFQCEYCQRVYNRDDYKTEAGKYLYQCDLPNCRTSQPFKTFSIFKKHHKKNCLLRPAYTCEYCGRNCFSSKSLEEHVISQHTKQYEFTCEICGYAGLNQTYLKRHMKFTHSDEKPFKCDICTEAFKDKRMLICHVRRHNNEMPYVCEICGKGFPGSQGFYKHKFVHETEKKYSCNICNKPFKSPHYVATHVWNAHKKGRSGIKKEKIVDNNDNNDNDNENENDVNREISHSFVATSTVDSVDAESMEFYGIGFKLSAQM